MVLRTKYNIYNNQLHFRVMTLHICNIASFCTKMMQHKINFISFKISTPNISNNRSWIFPIVTQSTSFTVFNKYSSIR